jgi:hypothetical protein
MFLIDATRVIVCLACLSFAAFEDLKTREVPDLVWVILSLAGLTLTGASLYLSPDQMAVVGLSLLITVSLAILLSWSSLWGSADSLALISIAIILPIYPRFSPVLSQSPFLHPLLPLSTLANAAIVSMVSIAYSLGKNLAWKLTQKDRALFQGIKGGKFEKALVSLVGFKVKFEELWVKSYLFPLEDVVNEEATLKLYVGVKKREEILERLATRKKPSDEVFVMLGLPMVLFVMAGLVISLIVGDLPITFLGWLFFR